MSRRSRRRAPPKPPGRTSSPHRGWRPAAIAAASIRPRPSARWSALFALLPAIVDAVGVPVVATGGIADGRGVAAALALGASAAQIGTAFLRCPEAGIHPAWAAALAKAAPEDTMITRAFSGRAGRGHRHLLCPRRGGDGRARLRALSRPARTDGGDARRRPTGRRRRTHAGLGRTVGRARPPPAGRRNGARNLGRVCRGLLS